MFKPIFLVVSAGFMIAISILRLKVPDQTPHYTTQCIITALVSSAFVVTFYFLRNGVLLWVSTAFLIISTVFNVMNESYSVSFWALVVLSIQISCMSICVACDPVFRGDVEREERDVEQARKDVP